MRYWMRWTTVLCLLLAMPATAAEPELKTDDDKTLYALGLLVARSLEQYALSADELKLLELGINDGVLHRTPKVKVEEWDKKLQAFAHSRLQAAAEAEKKASAEFLKKMEGEKNAVKYDSGLIMIEMKPGSGDSPGATDTVKVHYHGTLRDGTVFDSSVDRGTPATFPLNGVVKCWTEALQKMKVGGKSKVVCPSAIAYGDRGAPPRIKPGAALVFEVELLEIVKTGDTSKGKAE